MIQTEMEFCGSDVTPAAAAIFLDTPECTEEKEQVALTDALIGQVGLFSINLTERRPPFWLPRDRFGSKIRIQVAPTLFANFTQTRHKRRERATIPQNVAKSFRRLRITLGRRNREGEDSPVRENRAMALSSFRVESLAAEHDSLHR